MSCSFGVRDSLRHVEYGDIRRCTSRACREGNGIATDEEAHDKEQRGTEGHCQESGDEEGDGTSVVDQDHGDPVVVDPKAGGG